MSEIPLYLSFCNCKTGISTPSCGKVDEETASLTVLEYSPGDAEEISTRKRL